MSFWCRMQNLPAQLVADHAGISRQTPSKLENGSTSVGFNTFLRVCNTLGVGVLDRVIEATDPYETDLGPLRADQTLPLEITVHNR